MRVHSFSIPLVVLFAYFLVPFILHFPHAIAATAFGGGGGGHGVTVPVSDGPTVRKEERWPLEFSEFGEVSAVKISDGQNGCYHLHFITMDPNSLFLPVHLYSQMLFYVNSGSGTLNWINVEEDDDKLQTAKLQRGDIYRLPPQTVFYLQNDFVSNNPQKLGIYAIFSDSNNELQNGKFAKAYASIQDLLLGFDDKVLQSALSVPEEVIEELREGRQSLIVQGQSETYTSMWEVGSRAMIRAFLGTNNHGVFEVENKKKAYNILKADHDIENCYGWSATVTSKQLDVLKDTDFGVIMVNLTKGVMMGPHWNPNGAEVAIVLRGQGMIHVVCPTIASTTVCENSRFRVAEGDVFVVPKFHPMAQISFNNDSFVFMGFTITSKKKYLAGKSSILQKLDKKVLTKSFNVGSTTIDQVLFSQREYAIYDCTSCAEEEERLMEQQAGRERGGRGWRQREGEIATREEEEMQRRQRESEEAAERGREAEGEGGSYGHGIQ
ncbi:hypothetical protein L2E82_33865 [Cichorium intybus]|uniref:Uncharacterized protein n=1 Tax=Cichorium intybus TaxID=13427 RepID=A0ACB9BL77_CICIN|nr:hypothetical protein L2E82_33865 [Cichorium intybus]